MKKHILPWLRINQVLLLAIWYPYCWLQVQRAKRADCVELCEIYNFEKRYEGWQTVHLYKIRCVFREDATDEEMYKIVRLFRKKEYGKFSRYEEYVIGCNRFVQSGTNEIIDYEFDN